MKAVGAMKATGGIGVAVALSVALLCAQTSRATTAPSSHYRDLVKITSKGITVFQFVGYTDSPNGDLVPISGPIARGADMSFTIVNQTKRTDGLVVLGHRSPAVGPGKTGYLSHIPFPVRGRFEFKTTRDAGARYRGFIVVR